MASKADPSDYKHELARLALILTIEGNEESKQSQTDSQRTLVLSNYLANSSLASLVENIKA